MKKFTSLLLFLTLAFSLSSTALAAESSTTPYGNKFSSWDTIPELKINQTTLAQSNDPIVKANSDAIISIATSIEQMSVEELNDFINNIASDSVVNAQTYGQRSLANTYLQLKAAWLAAAQIAKAAGYTCAARAVEYSVLGIDYTEDTGAGGLFRDKIVATNVYKNYIASIEKAGKSYARAVKEFTASDSSDLFYALHNATITAQKSGNAYYINVYDIFDFAYDNDYSGLFTTLVNNWAWLCQNTSILNPIEINVNFTA